MKGAVNERESLSSRTLKNRCFVSTNCFSKKWKIKKISSPKIVTENCIPCCNKKINNEFQWLFNSFSFSVFKHKPFEDCFSVRTFGIYFLFLFRFLFLLNSKKYSLIWFQFNPLKITLWFGFNLFEFEKFWYPVRFWFNVWGDIGSKFRCFPSIRIAYAYLSFFGFCCGG